MLNGILKYVGEDEGSRSRAADSLDFLQKLDDSLADRWGPTSERMDTDLSDVEVAAGRRSSRYTSMSRDHESSEVEYESSAHISESDYGEEALPHKIFGLSLAVLGCGRLGRHKACKFLQ